MEKEMERDSLLASGVSANIVEGYMKVSDNYMVNLCKECGNIVSGHNECRNCKLGEVKSVNMPYSFKLLVQELSMLGVNIKFNLV
jgi:DNA-directed RNA polymerase beta subunit